jgi:ribosome-associated protein
MWPDPDESNHDDDSPTDVSRSQRRREALDVLRLAQTLSEMSDAQLKSIPLSDDLVEEVRRTRAVTQQIARKRQSQYLAKQMRRLDDEELEAIRAALEHDRSLSRRETAVLHQIESWRERLLADGDDALTELLAAFPAADRQHLRQLARQARSERAAEKPPHAYRELFRSLRELFGAAPDEASE